MALYLRVIFNLILLFQVQQTLARSEYYSFALEQLNLDPDLYFNAAYGARVTVDDTEGVNECTSGSYCLPQWWSSLSSLEEAATPPELTRIDLDDQNSTFISEVHT